MRVCVWENVLESDKCVNIFVCFFHESELVCSYESCVFSSFELNSYKRVMYVGMTRFYPEQQQNTLAL